MEDQDNALLQIWQFSVGATRDYDLIKIDALPVIEDVENENNETPVRKKR